MPLFSPSQVPKRELVLRSIWSPPPAVAEPKTITPRKKQTPRKEMTTPVSMDQFYSPHASPISVMSEGNSFRTSASFRTCSNSTIHVPVDMLSFDYVSNCQSEHELAQIVSTLTQDGGSYPSLLRMAQRKLETVSAASSASKSVRWAPPSHHASPPSMNESSVALNESSLVMSLSTTMMLEDSLALSPTPKSRASKLFTFEEEPFAEELDNVQNERRALELELSQQVHVLQDRLRKESQDQNQQHTSLKSKIQDLEQARAAAEDNVTLLDQALKTSNQKQMSIVASMETMSRESHFLKQQLDAEQRTSRDTVQKSYEVETQLRHQVTTLSTNNNSAALEVQLQKRAQVEAALTTSLSNAKSQLQAIRDEQTATLSTLQQALGRDTGVVTTLDMNERRDLVRDVTRKLASSKAAVKAFAQAMASAEKDRYTLKEAHRLAQNRIAELAKMRERLQRENNLLVKQNATLAEKLEDTNSNVAELQVNQEEYKHTIGLLRKQIRSTESSVSMKLYQQTVSESRASKRLIQEKTATIQTLERQMKQQEKAMQQERQPTQARAVQEMQANQQLASPSPTKADVLRRRQTAAGGASLERMRAATRVSPTARNHTPPVARPPPPPPPMISPTAPLMYHPRRMDPPASKSAFVPAIPPPPPRSRAPLATVAPPSSIVRPQTATTPRRLGSPTRQSSLTDTAARSPPPHPSPATTQRAYKRLGAIKAAGGRNGIREKLMQIRRSPLGNVTNKSRGEIF